MESRGRLTCWLACVIWAASIGVIAGPQLNNPPVHGYVASDTTIVATHKLTLVFTASDPDPGQTVTLQILEPLPAGAAFVPLSFGTTAEAQLTWTPAPAQADASYALTLRAVDSLGRTTDRPFAIHVQPEGTAEQIVVTDVGMPRYFPTGASVDVSVHAHSTYGGPLTYQLWVFGTGFQFQSPVQNSSEFLFSGAADAGTYTAYGLAFGQGGSPQGALPLSVYAYAPGQAVIPSLDPLEIELVDTGRIRLRWNSNPINGGLTDYRVTLTSGFFPGTIAPVTVVVPAPAPEPAEYVHVLDFAAPGAAGDALRSLLQALRDQRAVSTFESQFNVSVEASANGGGDYEPYLLTTWPLWLRAEFPHALTAEVAVDETGVLVTVGDFALPGGFYDADRLRIYLNDGETPLYDQPGSALPLDRIVSLSGYRPISGDVLYLSVADENVPPAAIELEGLLTSAIVVLPGCSDNLDNDGDGLVDFPADPGCIDALDETEKLWYDYPFATSEGQSTIDWDLFGAFSLPDRFTFVYQGPPMGDTTLGPLRNGFSHVVNTPVPELLQPEQRAVLWNGQPGAAGFPWKDFASPWPDAEWSDFVDDPDAWDGIVGDHYEPEWEAKLISLADNWGDVGLTVPPADIVCGDIERRFDGDAILGIRGPANDSRIPPSINALDDDAFIARYERDMARMYTRPYEYLRDLGFTGKITSYSDVPSVRTWWGITQHTWDAWRTDRSLLNYIMGDYTQPGGGFDQAFGPFYDALDILTPSAYLFYNYPETRAEDPGTWTTAADYLSYALFQVESNRAWNPDGKPIVLFEWLLYHDCCGGGYRPLRPHQVQALAIFPIFSGADGVWLWDWSGYPVNGPKRFSNYEHFNHGLSRLAQFSTMLDGEYAVHIPEPARDTMAANSPVWRGIIRNGQMLVAAHNPYAEHELGETTTIDVDYDGEYVGTLQVEGLNTFLGTFPLPFDCDPSEPSSWRRPGEARDLRFEADGDTLSWRAPEFPGALDSATGYDTLRSTQAADFGGATCVESNDTTDRQATDPAEPPRSHIWHYLVRARNACPDGAGELGTASDGTPRVASTCP